MATEKRQTAEQLRDSLARYDAALGEQVERAAARCVRYVALGLDQSAPYTEWTTLQLARAFLANWTDGEFGEPFDRDAKLPDPLPVYEIRSAFCPACGHKGRTFITAAQVYGCPECPHTSTKRDA